MAAAPRTTQRRTAWLLAPATAWLFFSIILSIANPRSHFFTSAQRLKESCWDVAPLTCRPQQSWRPLPDGILAHDVCLQLHYDVFRGAESLNTLTNQIYLNVSLHQTYLEGLEADSDLCTWLQDHDAYSRCIFCNDYYLAGEDLELGVGAVGCALAHSSPVCVGELPTLDDVLSATEGPFAEINSQGYLDKLCLIMEAGVPLENRTFEGAVSRDACEVGLLVLHLCPGACDGICFDGMQHTPSCELASTDRYQTFDNSDFCAFVDTFAFGFAAIMDVEEIRASSLDVETYGQINGEFLDCNDVRKAFPTCWWCQDQERGELCFQGPDDGNGNSPYLLSCEPPADNEVSILLPPLNISMSGKFIDPFENPMDYEEAICSRLIGEIQNRDLSQGFTAPHILDITSHQEMLLLPKQSDLCLAAKQIYHKCFWCENANIILHDLQQQGDEHYKSVDDLPSEIVRRPLETNFCYDPGKMCEKRDLEVPLDILESPRLFYFGGETTGMEPVNHTLQELSEMDASQRADLCAESQVPLPVSYSTRRCYEVIQYVRLCPNLCLGPETVAPELIDKSSYLGATNTKQKRAIIWMSRLAAIFSFFGATYILNDVLSNPKARKTVYHQLLVGIAIFDMVTAFAWCFATAPIDATEEGGGGHIEGAIGNEGNFEYSFILFVFLIQVVLTECLNHHTFSFL